MIMVCAQAIKNESKQEWRHPYVSIAKTLVGCLWNLWLNIGPHINKVLNPHTKLKLLLNISNKVKAQVEGVQEPKRYHYVIITYRG
jgi:hypothetical protein